MLVIVGLLILLVAVVVAVVGMLGNSGAAHPLNESFSVFGYHLAGSTGALFLFGMVIGAVAMLGLSVLLAGARRTAGRGRDARRDLVQSQRETAFANRDRDSLLEHQQGPEVATGDRNRSGLFSRWSRAPRSTDQAVTNRPGSTDKARH